MEQTRLQKYLADAGVASRRKAEELILQGRVYVNGETVTEMGVKVTDKDIIEVDGKRIKQEEKKVYIMLNKPVGYVTTVKDQFSRPTVMDLLMEIRERIYPVGRLDYDTSGLLLFTNDGDFTYKLTHPKHEMVKIYIAEVEGTPNAAQIEQFKAGLKIEDYITAPAGLRIIKKKNNTSTVEVTIHEGRNRQVRNMCEAIGHPVRKLKRIAIDKVAIGGLAEGEWRYLDKHEIKALCRCGS